MYVSRPFSLPCNHGDPSPKDTHNTHFYHCKSVVDTESQNSCRNDKHFCAEGVALRIIRTSELPEDEDEAGVRAEDKRDLHDRIVVRDKAGEEVEVACCEDHGVQHLAFAADACIGGRRETVIRIIPDIQKNGCDSRTPT